MKRKNEIKFNVNTKIKTNIYDEKELVKTFNKKLLKIIMSFENGKR